MQSLLDDQRIAIEKLRKYKVGALFMKPGTGKTRTACELIKSTPCDYVLWLTPFQTKDSLRAEISKWSDIDPDIAGIETLSSSDRAYLDLYEKLSRHTCPFVIVDESLKIKNWTAKRTKRIIQLGRMSQYRLILNGTPLSRDLLDIWAQMEFLSSLILNMGMGEFKNTFCEYTRITYRQGSKSFVREYITKYHNVDYLYSVIEPYVYECDIKIDIKRQYFDLPYKIDDQARAEYARLKSEYLDNEKLLAMNNNIFLELTQKMQHLYCCTEDKITVLKKILSDDLHKTIIFTKFTASADAIKIALPGAMVLSYQKHAFGLNLQQYNRCIFFDKTWDYAQRVQAEARIYREGQSEECYYYDLTGDVNLEQLIKTNIEKKQGLLEYFKSIDISQLREAI